MQITISRYTPQSYRLWNDFVCNNSKNGTFLICREYMDYHCDRFEDFSLIVSDDKGKIRALLPANLFQNTICSHGGLTYGGFVTDVSMTTTVMLEVFASVLDYLCAHKIEKLVYKTIPYIYHKLPSEEDRYALFLCNAKLLRRDVLTIINDRNKIQFQERRRRKIKVAKKNGLFVEETYDFTRYWNILEQLLMSKYQTKPVHSLFEITMLASRFPENIKLFACYKETEMLAGVVMYESDLVGHVQYIASTGEGKNMGALDLIFDFLINEYYRQKPFFDFGISNEKNGLLLNQGLIEQKEGFGARAVVHDQYEIRIDDKSSELIRKAIV
ncbi:GNAT family N-acetyltransferase [Heliobacterium gestii]|uniref:GNAT family N-acetyltransferase n=1 Tax=Heliomicrobium gestii TaxID=2699 RepID=A0A845L8M8_HELGE|nr:GNAT family N-acetyltransferase [Heliomicrobium gestii]MBM7866623.1 hypothetical protein [Heliomicrobium gestii]MZP43097.1 GNAT family N-acetyltransferase [Heliomicrobium gestii]